MKNILMTTLLIFSAAPVTGFAASIVDEGKALEAKMDKVPPIEEDKPTAASAQTAEAQDEVAVAAAQFIKAHLKGKLDQPSFEAICRILVRAYSYDRDDTVGELNQEQIERNTARIDKTFKKFEEEGKFSRKTLEKVRPIYRQTKASENVPNEAKKTATAAARVTPAPAKKQVSKAGKEDGAALPKCLSGGRCEESRASLLTLTKSAFGNLAARLSKKHGQSTSSSFDPTPRNR